MPHPKEDFREDSEFFEAALEEGFNDEEEANLLYDSTSFDWHPFGDPNAILLGFLEMPDEAAEPWCETVEGNPRMEG